MRVVMNPSGVRAVMREPGVRAELLRRMERVADRANATAPVGATGSLSTSHRAYVDERPESQLPVARVASDESYALVVESRTGYLSSALDGAGGDW